MLTLVATLTLTPALLVLLARYRPRSFDGLRGSTSDFWERVGHLVLRRPLLIGTALTLLMAVPQESPAEKAKPEAVAADGDLGHG